MTTRQFRFSKAHTLLGITLLILCQLLTLGEFAIGQEGAKLERLIKRDNADGVQKVIQAGPASLLKSNLPSSRIPPLHLAIQNRKVAATKMLLDLGSPIVSTDRRKRSALHLAISSRNPEIIKAVVEKAENVDLRDRNQATPLMHAVMYSSTLEIIELLLAKGADVEAKNSNQQRPLHLACHYGRTEIARRLLESGANVAVVDRRGMTPFLAACSKNVELVDLLLSKGADPLVRNSEGESALHWACRARQPAVAARVHTFFDDVDVLNSRSQTPLLLSVQNGNVAAAKLLIERGADLNRYDGDRANPQTNSRTAWPLLHYPASRGQTEMLKLLVDSGANVNATDPTGNSALHGSVTGGANRVKFGSNVRPAKNESTPPDPFLQNIELLIAAQADVNLKNDEGATAIKLAAQQDYFQAVEALVDGADDLDFQIGNGRLIHWAAQNGLKKTVKRLLDKKQPNNDQPNNDRDELERTPLHYASANGSLQIVEMLIEKGFDTSAKDIDGMTAVMMAAEGNHADVAWALIQSGVHMEADSRGQTAVHLAAWNGASEVIEVLTRTIDVDNLKTETGYTPQHAAAWQGHAKVVGQLVLAGADPNAADSDGWTPLHKAAFRGHADVVKVLLEKGANKDLKTAAGLTAISMADGSKKADVVKLLSD